MQTYNPRHKRSLSSRIKSAVWLMVNRTFFRWSPFFMHGWRVLILRLFGAKIGRAARVKRTVIFKCPWNLILGDEVMICDNAHVFCEGKVIIGDRAQIGENTWILTGSHDVDSYDFKFECAPIRIGKASWIATNAMILSGRSETIIGDGAVVAAGSVVVKNVGGGEIVGGSPARYLRRREILY